MAGTHFDIWSYFHFSHSDFLNTSGLSQLSLFVFSKPVFYVRTFVNVKDGYFINLASLGSSDLYVRELGTSNWNSWIVCKKTSKSIGGDVLFTVVSVPAGKYDKEKYSSYITIMQTSDVVVNVSVNRDDLDEETIRKAVMKLPL